MAKVFELAINDANTTRYVVEERLPDGRVMLRPQTELEAIRERLASRPLSDDEFAELIAPTFSQLTEKGKPPS